MPFFAWKGEPETIDMIAKTGFARFTQGKTDFFSKKRGLPLRFPQNCVKYQQLLCSVERIDLRASPQYCRKNDSRCGQHTAEHYEIQHRNRLFGFAPLPEIFATETSHSGHDAPGADGRDGAPLGPDFTSDLLFIRFPGNVHELSCHDRRLRFLVSQFARSARDLQRLSCAAYLDGSGIRFQSERRAPSRRDFHASGGTADDQALPLGRPRGPGELFALP